MEEHIQDFSSASFIVSGQSLGGILAGFIVLEHIF